MSEWLQELRYSIRTLAKAPGFTLVAVLSLALGIGVNTAVLAVGRAVLFQPLNVSDPGALVIAYNWRGDTANGLMQINSDGMKDEATGRSLGSNFNSARDWCGKPWSRASSWPWPAARSVSCWPSGDRAAWSDPRGFVAARPSTSVPTSRSC